MSLSAVVRDPLSPDALGAIHDQAMRLLEEVGTEVHHDGALALLAQAGMRVDGTRVRWDAGFVLERVAGAPSRSAVHGRDRARVVELGGGSLAHAPVGGSPFATDLERGRRDGTIADHDELVRLAHATGVLPILQSGTVEAQGLPETGRHLAMDYSIVRWSGRPYITYGTSGPRTLDAIRLAELVAGGAEALAERPGLIGIVNPNSPLVWDELMVGTLLACAEAGQPIAPTPFLLAGASAPVSLAGGLSLLVAEALSGVALAQLVP